MFASEWARIRNTCTELVATKGDCKTVSCSKCPGGGYRWLFPGYFTKCICNYGKGKYRSQDDYSDGDGVCKADKGRVAAAQKWLNDFTEHIAVLPEERMFNAFKALLGSLKELKDLVWDDK